MVQDVLASYFVRCLSCFQKSAQTRVACELVQIVTAGDGGMKGPRSRPPSFGQTCSFFGGPDFHQNGSQSIVRIVELGFDCAILKHLSQGRKILKRCNRLLISQARKIKAVAADSPARRVILYIDVEQRLVSGELAFV